MIYSPVVEIRHLRMLAAIMRAGTVSRAGELIYMTQSAISHALLDLESKLGLQLFERSRQGMLPTAAGRQLIDAAHRILEDLELAEHELRATRERTGPLVRVACGGYTAFHWLAPTLATAVLRGQPMRVEVVPEAARDPVGRLAAGTLDMAIVREGPVPPGIDLEPIGPDRVVFVHPPTVVIAGEDIMAMLDDHPFVAHLDAEVLLQRVGRAVDISALGSAVNRSTEAALAMVAAGSGITLMTEWATMAAVANGSVCSTPLPRDLGAAMWCVARRPAGGRRSVDQAVTAVTRALVETGLTTVPGTPQGRS